MYVHHNDALVWLEQEQSRYDVVFVDAYAADGSVPAHLATHHFCQTVHQSLLDPASLVVVNVTGDDKQMLADVVTLYGRTFAHVLKIEVPSYRYANHVLVAFNCNKLDKLDIARLMNIVDAKRKSEFCSQSHTILYDALSETQSNL